MSTWGTDFGRANCIQDPKMSYFTRLSDHQGTQARVDLLGRDNHGLRNHMSRVLAIHICGDKPQLLEL